MNRMELEALLRKESDDEELWFYEKCPHCGAVGTLDGEHRVFNVKDVPEHRIVRLYNRIARKWNNLMSTLFWILHGGIYRSDDPKIIRMLTWRRRFKLVPGWFYRVLPRLPFWKPVLWGYFILECRHCKIQILSEDPREFIHFYDPDDLEEGEKDAEQT